MTSEEVGWCLRGGERFLTVGDSTQHRGTCTLDQGRTRMSAVGLSKRQAAL